LDALANRHRVRRKPAVPVADPADPPARSPGTTLVDLAYARHYGPIGQTPSTDDPTSEGK
jgi:hypothetical protein